jgi:hypothetical protein
VKSLILSFGREPQVRVDRAIETIRKEAFGLRGGPSTVQFESESKLSRIEARAFSGSYSLKSICVPSSVEFLDGSTFCESSIHEIQLARGNRRFRISGQFVLSFDGTVLICFFGAGSTVKIHREIEVIAPRAFARYRFIRMIEFEKGSRLRPIESFAFSHSDAIASICLPSFVDTIDGSAFCDSNIREVIIAQDNRHFRKVGDFLLSGDGTRLIRYFGRSWHVVIGREIEELSVSSFESCGQIWGVSFEAGSRVRVIGPRAFRRCRVLSSISIPASMDCLSGSCFAKCAHLNQVLFAPGSNLSRIEEKSFEGCSSLPEILIPESVRGRAGLDLSGVGSIPIAWYRLAGEPGESKQ